MTPSNNAPTARSDSACRRISFKQDELEITPLDDFIGTPDAREAWQDACREDGNVNYDLRYLAATRSANAGLVHIALLKCAEGVVRYPFVVRPLDQLDHLAPSITEGLSDIVTPYEYGGPLSHPKSPTQRASMHSKFSSSFESFCRSVGIVSEFVRFDPVLGAHDGWGEWYDMECAAQHIVIRLDQDLEQIRQSYSPHHRRDLSKWNGRKVELGKSLHLKVISSTSGFIEFCKVYTLAMAYLEASPEYIFPMCYFSSIAELSPDLVTLYGAVDESERLVAGVILIHDGRTTHYHLSCIEPRRRGEISHLPLIDFAIEDQRQRGRTTLHMGGAAQSQSGLQRFKSGFSSDRCAYFVGRRIHQSALYEVLSSNHESRVEDVLKPAMRFPAYRL